METYFVKTIKDLEVLVKKNVKLYMEELKYKSYLTRPHIYISATDEEFKKLWSERINPQKLI